MFRVSVDSVLPGCEKMDPPSQPPDVDKELELGECFNWPLLWPKALIRLDPPVGGSAPTLAKATTPPVLESPVEAPARPHGKGAAVDDPGLDDFDDGGFMADLDDPLPELYIQTVVPDLPEKAPKHRRLFNFNY